ncbi:MAG: exopolysaccharide biosynthesis protein [Caulobacterales bacterium]
MTHKSDKVHNLSSLLDALKAKIDEDGEVSPATKISLEEMLDLIGRRAYGPLLLIIGLISISPLTLIPGSTWAIAVLTLVISVQMALHKTHPWMPKKALALQLTEDKLDKFISAARPTARFTDKLIRPRWSFLSEPPWALIVAILCALAALVTFPLGFIPFAPLAPGLAVAFFGLGLTAKDGLMLSLGALIMAAASWLLVTRLI